MLETSPNKYQAWVKLTDEEVGKEAATRIAQERAFAFVGDPNPADYRRLGRLAGFTNRDPLYERNGFHPYVSLHEHRKTTATRGQDLVDRAEKQLRASHIHRVVRGKEQFRSSYWERLSYLEVVKDRKELPRKQDGEIDWSRVDYRAARDLARAGYPRDYISRELMKYSPEMASRRGKDALSYANRTATRAIESLSLTLKGAGREPEKDRSWKDMDKGM